MIPMGIRKTGLAVACASLLAAPCAMAGGLGPGYASDLSKTTVKGHLPLGHVLAWASVSDVCNAAGECWHSMEGGATGCAPVGGWVHWDGGSILGPHSFEVPLAKCASGSAGRTDRFEVDCLTVTAVLFVAWVVVDGDVAQSCGRSL